jgi:sugar O-acyltransferase (sialic acid O-acetyltransferase NeuD family)
MTRTLIILGAGGHGRAACEMAQLLGWQVAGFLDDRGDEAPTFADVACIGVMADLSAHASHVDAAVVAIGNNPVRRRLQEQVRDTGIALASLVHPGAVVAPSVAVGEGCMIMAGATVATEAVLADGVIVNAGATVDHHCRIADYGHLGTGVCMAGGSRVGEGAWVQAGSALGYGAVVAPGEVLAPGSVRGPA